MFSKKIKCIRCGKNIDKKYDFCPFCGSQLKETKKRKEDFNNMEKQFEDAFNMPFFVKFPFRQLVKQLEKQFDAQIRELDKDLAKKNRPEKQEIEKIPNAANVAGFSISISGGEGNEPVIRIKELGKPNSNGETIRIKTPEERIEENAERLTLEKMHKPAISEAKARKFAKLPKSEPETKVRRLTDKVVYEIALPGVENIKDVIITKLQNSIEIKAFAKDKAYFKLIPVALPIKRYRLESETLILELVP